jgi:Flp pilus assembly pilin Flp
MMKSISKFARNEQADVHIEYGLIALLIGVFIMTAIESVSGGVSANYNTIANAFSTGDTTGSIPR